MEPVKDGLKGARSLGKQAGDGLCEKQVESSPQEAQRPGDLKREPFLNQALMKVGRILRRGCGAQVVSPCLHCTLLSRHQGPGLLCPHPHQLSVHQTAVGGPLHAPFKPALRATGEETETEAMLPPECKGMQGEGSYSKGPGTPPGQRREEGRR